MSWAAISCLREKREKRDKPVFSKLRAREVARNVRRKAVGQRRSITISRSFRAQGSATHCESFQYLNPIPRFSRFPRMKGQQPRTIYTAVNLKLYRWHNAKGEQLNVWSVQPSKPSQGSGELGREVLSGDAPWLRKTRKPAHLMAFLTGGSE